MHILFTLEWHYRDQDANAKSHFLIEFLLETRL